MGEQEAYWALDSESNLPGGDDTWSAGEAVAFSLVVAAHCALLAFTLYRLVILYRFRNNIRIVFHVLLGVTCLLRLVHEIVYAEKSCQFHDGDKFDGVCDGFYLACMLLGSVTFFLCYFVTMLSWGEFVHLVRTHGRSDFFRRARLPIALVVGGLTCFYFVYIGLLIASANGDLVSAMVLEKFNLAFMSVTYLFGSLLLGWFGTQVTLQLKFALGTPPPKLVFRILGVALACTILLFARALWNITQLFWTAADLNAGYLDWRYIIYNMLCELIPASLMLLIMMPTPIAPQQSRMPTERTRMLPRTTRTFNYYSNKGRDSRR